MMERKKFEQVVCIPAQGGERTIMGENWDRLTTYYEFPREHWKHLRTSNVVESPFSPVCMRTACFPV